MRSDAQNGSPPIEVVVGGHICLDIIPAIPNPSFAYSPGQLVEVGQAALSTGGPVSNTGLALHKLGLKTRLMGKVADDLFGRATRELVAAVAPELAAGMIEAAGEISSYSVIISPAGSDRMFLHCAGCNDTFSAQDVDYSLLEQTRLFHFGYPPIMRRLIEDDGAELAHLLKQARETGVTTSLDMTMPDPAGYSGQVDWPAILDRCLPYVDVFMPSLEEILFMLHPDVYAALPQPDLLSGVTPGLVSAVAAGLLAQGPGLVGLKMGRLGLYLRTAGAERWSAFGPGAPPHDPSWAGREIWSPCFQAEVVGTTGAGDATIAGFFAAWLRGLSLEECATMACAVGGCNVEAPDALSGIRGWEQTRQRVEAGWRRRVPEQPLTGWREASSGLWHGPADSNG